ncbi:MAG: hypothetical protein V1686_02900 [Patescibacteria group bacterium]
MFNKIFSKENIKWLIVGFIIMALFVFVFAFGVWIGGEKARFSSNWADNYHKNFAGPQNGFNQNWRNMPGGEFINAHGLFGEVIKIDANSFVIKGRENMENVVIVNQDTIIKRLSDNIQLKDLKVGEFVVIIGSPNNSGQIEAKLIRIMPQQTSMAPGAFNPINFR